MSGTFAIWLTVGVLFAPLGAIMAGLITYQEYRQHHLAKGRALREALVAAGFAGAVLLALAVAAGWAMD